MRIIETKKGSKNQHPLTTFICECGNARTVRSTRLRASNKTNSVPVSKCVSCSFKDAAKTATVTRRARYGNPHIAESFRAYKHNAKKKGHIFKLSREEFGKMIFLPCFYCGHSEIYGVNGVDRKDNAVGYTLENSVPCCATCNFAKRQMTVAEFIAWVDRVHAYQGFRVSHTT